MTEGAMLREELMLSLDWTEEVVLFNGDSRYIGSAVLVPGMRKIVHAATQAINVENR
ncbi:hypothetical protein [Alicycliphilus denitrificans]|nr:hypothetical protein [Alicycliphilus denitrificans]GAO24098.1 hypothetical protein ALISP_3918 [Alicycliphilus sp. B1]